MTKQEIIDRINSGSTLEAMKKQIQDEYNQKLSKISEVEKEIKESEKQELEKESKELAEKILSFYEKKYGKIENREKGLNLISKILNQDFRKISFSYPNFDPFSFLPF